jgi:hypothetical protein
MLRSALCSGRFTSTVVSPVPKNYETERGVPFDCVDEKEYLWRFVHFVDRASCYDSW